MSGCRPTTEKVEKRPPEFAKKTAKKNESRSRKNFGVAFFFFFRPALSPCLSPYSLCFLVRCSAAAPVFGFTLFSSPASWVTGPEKKMCAHPR